MFNEGNTITKSITNRGHLIKMKNLFCFGDERLDPVKDSGVFLKFKTDSYPYTQENIKKENYKGISTTNIKITMMSSIERFIYPSVNTINLRYGDEKGPDDEALLLEDRYHYLGKFHQLYDDTFVDEIKNPLAYDEEKGKRKLRNYKEAIDNTTYLPDMILYLGY